jgi:hypothetical protein
MDKLFLKSCEIKLGFNFQKNDFSWNHPLVRQRAGAGQLLFFHPTAHHVQVTLVQKVVFAFVPLRLLVFRYFA